MFVKSRKLLLKIILDTFSLLVLGIILLVINFGIEPVQRGFYCNDMTIRYPYHENTITTITLFVLVLVPVFLSIIIIEIYRHQNKKLSTKTCKTIHEELYDKLLPYLFGLLSSLLCTFISKVSTGRLRPYFHSICKPNVLCNASDLQYIEDFQCTGIENSPAIDLQKEMRLSFMSGHSSLMAYSMVYLTIYLQKRLPISPYPGIIFRSLLQCLALNLAFYVGYTRISDYWHHWSDVLMGLIQGSISAIITVIYLSDLCVEETSFKRNLESNDSNSENEQDFSVGLIEQTAI